MIVHGYTLYGSQAVRYIHQRNAVVQVIQLATDSGGTRVVVVLVEIVVEVRVSRQFPIGEVSAAAVVCGGRRVSKRKLSD